MKKTKKKSSTLKKDTQKQEENVFIMLKHGLKSPQFPLVVGVFFFLLAVFCLVSFVSFFFSAIIDYEGMKNLSAYDLLSNVQNINNWGGSFGAFISYVIITKTFGFGAIGFLVLIVLFSLRLFKIENQLFSKWIVATMVIMLWVSCAIGYIVVAFEVESLEYFAGVVGISINQILCSLLGRIGCGIVLLAFTITIPMLLFGVKYLWVRKVVVDITKPKQKEIDPKTQQIDEITDDKEELSKQEQTQNTDKEDTKKDKQRLEELIRQSQLQQEEEETTFIIKQLDENGQVKQETTVKAGKTEEKVKQETTCLEKNTDNSEQDDIIAIENTINKENTENISQPISMTSQEDNINGEDIPFTITQQTANNEQEEQDIVSDEIETKHYTIDTPYDPHLELSNYQFPSTDFLIDYDKNNTIMSEKELVANKNRIVQTLSNYKIEISSIQATVGPTVTLYEIIPAPGIRISKIKSLEDDIALSLSALGIRIIAPIPGRGTIGIEVPNSKPQIVSMKSMLECNAFLDNKYELPVAIGKRIDNTPYVTDLAKMPHLLMAGATGQGKSVGLNAIISSLLYKKHPCDLKFIFVDPKKVELSLYSKLEKHYLAKVPNGKNAVITDVKEVVYTLRSLCQLMDTRYELLKDAGCKKITEYNKKFIARKLNPLSGHQYMPYIVLIIDEFADLIMTAGKEIEKPICRLAQLARAVGIHLIIATQRPSVNIITGTIKANFPARAAFKVSSLMDSRTILDTKGAEQLVGRGDMLISNGGPLVRLQCALIDTEEIEKVVDFISEQQGFADCFLLPEVVEDADEDGGEKKNLDDGKIDGKFEEAARLIVMTQQGSTSMLQRKLALGYNRAGRVMDQLEGAGIVGPFRGSKARDVLVSTEEELNEILANVLNK